MTNSVKEAINKAIPYREAEYRNGVVASIILHGKGDKLTEDWIRRTLLSDVQDGFMTYGQALMLAPMYKEAIANLKMH